MKKIIIVSVLFVFTQSFVSFSQNVGINNENATPDASAILDVKSTSKGLLLPRMTTTQRDAIISPAMALMIFNLDTKCYEGYNAEDATWYAFGCLTSGSNESPWPDGAVYCIPTPTEIVDVVNPQSGKTWMDRNLGATQVATSSTDSDSYGDLYQWGRFTDGHQCRNSPVTSSLSSSDQPGHDNFITPTGVLGDPFDWRDPKNDNLWQGVNGINNPCPSGYRLPTETELNGEMQTWDPDNSTGAFNSLKFTMAGYRNRTNGNFASVNTAGTYWTSTVVGNNAKSILYNNSFDFYNRERSYGFSVRCIKD